MTTRKGFIAASAALAAVPGIASAGTPAPKPSPSEEPLPKLKFDLAGFNAILDRDAAHKHLFTARNFDTGAVFDAVHSTLDGYRDIGVAASSIAPIVVLYHSSVPLGFDDYAWSTYLAPWLNQGKKIEPSSTKDIDTLFDGRKDAGIDALVTQYGLHIFVCNNALSALSVFVAKSQHKRPTDVYEDLSAHLAPNATVVPAGVWAIHAIQEKKYTLLETSL